MRKFVRISKTEEKPLFIRNSAPDKYYISAAALRRNGENIMAYKISDECISCGTCEAGCPVGAISMGDNHYEIATDTCIECGACEASCPISAIEAE